MLKYKTSGTMLWIVCGASLVHHHLEESGHSEDAGLGVLNSHGTDVGCHSKQTLAL